MTCIAGNNKNMIHKTIALFRKESCMPDIFLNNKGDICRNGLSEIALAIRERNKIEKEKLDLEKEKFEFEKRKYQINYQNQ
jgi:hypothetical protein